VLAPKPETDKEATAITFLRDALADGEWHDSLGLKALATTGPNRTQPKKGRS